MKRYLVSLIMSMCMLYGARYQQFPDNKYTVMYYYTDGASKEQKKLIHIFSKIAHTKRYARAGLKFRARYLTKSQFITARQLYGIDIGSTVMIFRDNALYKNARLSGPFTKDTLTHFIESWIGDYIDALASAKTASREAKKAISYASYPSYPYYGIYGYPYYGYAGPWGWGYGGYGAGYSMGIWF